MACFRFRAQSPLQHSTQDLRSRFVLNMVSDLDLDVVSSSLFELSCVGISGSQYSGTKCSVFLSAKILHLSSLRLEVQNLNFLGLIVPCYSLEYCIKRRNLIMCVLLLCLQFLLNNASSTCDNESGSNPISAMTDE